MHLEKCLWVVRELWWPWFQTSGRSLAGQFWNFCTKVVVGGHVVQVVLTHSLQCIESKLEK